MMEKFQLDSSELARLTTDGAPTMTGRTNGFTKKLLDTIDSQDLGYHCIIHQESLCIKAFDLTDVVKNV